MKTKIWPWRRAIQLLVLLLTIALPVVARYSHYLSARQLDNRIEKWQGHPQGELLALTDGVMRLGLPDGEGGVPTRRPRKAILERTRNFYGSPWSITLFGVSMTDLLAGAESFFASWNFTAAFWTGLLLPLLLTLLLGRVFCGWICPAGFLFDMTAKVRGFVKFLEINPPALRIWRGNKYIILALGLLFTAVASLPLLNYLYPPAIVSREIHGAVLFFFDAAERGSVRFIVGGLSGASLFLLLLFLGELFVAPRFFCRSICPGGAIYSALGRYRIWRVRRKIDRCTLCTLCNVHCPRGLLPMTDHTGMECDNCGVCIDVCPDDAIGFALSTTSAGIPGPTANQGKESADGHSGDGKEVRNVA